MRSAFHATAVALSMMLLFPSQSRATEQESDSIVLHGQTFALQSLPLEDYLHRHPDIRLPKRDVWMTSNDRGYTATWKVSKGSLLLQSVSDNIAETVFPRTPPPVVASWYSGLLCIAGGKPDSSRRGIGFDGFNVGYERYTFLFVRAGHVVKRMTLNLHQFRKSRRSQWEDFMRTEEYASQLAELKQSDTEMPEKEAEFSVSEDWFGTQFHAYVENLYAEAER